MNEIMMTSDNAETGDAIEIWKIKNVWIGRESFAVRQIRVPVSHGAYDVGLRLGSTDVPTFRQIFIDEDYDSAFLPEDAACIVDLGANVGYAAVFFGLKYPQAQILAVEPDEGNFRALYDNVAALGPRVAIEHAAIWRDDGVISLLTEDDKGDALGEWGVQVSDQATATRQTTPCIKLETLLQKHGVDHIDILKVDVEGAELELFSHDPASWLAKTDLILVETHDRFRPGSEEAVRKALADEFDELPANGENLVFRRKNKRTNGALKPSGAQRAGDVSAFESASRKWRDLELVQRGHELARLRRTVERLDVEFARAREEIVGLTAAKAEQDKVRLEWFEPELERRAKAAERLEAELARRAEEMQRLEAELRERDAAAQRLEAELSTVRAESLAGARQVENLRRQVATHQRQSLFYARELAATTAELGRVKEVSDALWREKETWFLPREAQLVAEVQRLNDELHRPPPIVNSSGFLQSLSRSFRMIGYVLFPFGKRRKGKRRKMLAALWKPK